LIVDKLFIDTGAFVARFLAKDNLHESAVKLWLKIEKSAARCVTSTAVLSETTTLLARRAEPLFAAKKIRSIYTSARFLIIRSDQELELKALALMEKYADLPLSYVDALSAVQMRHWGMKTIFSFDRDFAVLKFSLFK